MVNPFEEIITRLDSIEKALNKNHKIIKNNTEKVKMKFLNINETADLLKVKVPTIYKKVQLQSIPFIKKSGKLLFEETELINWLKTGKQKSQNQIADDLRKYLKGGEDL